MQIANNQQKKDKIKNDKLEIKINSDKNPYHTADIPQKFLQPRRLTSYFIVFIESGSITYKLDLEDITLIDGQLLFAMPNQVFTPPSKTDNLKYFKILFDETTTFYWGFAQKCALILAKEITNEFINKCCEHQNRTYWEEVQTEISNYNG